MIVLQINEVLIIFIYFLGGLLLSLICYKISIHFAVKYNLMDEIDEASHKIHSAPTPLAGGPAILVVFVFFSLIGSIYIDERLSKLILPILFIFIGGLIDDAKGSGVLGKIFWQFIGVALLISSGIQVSFIGTLISEPALAMFLDYSITIFWIIGVTNAFNLVDSMDGLVAGISLVTSILFIFVSLTSGQFYLAIEAALLAGICLGAIYYNSSPAMLFLGDSGSQTLGFIFATMAILHTPIEINQASSWFVPILFLAVPLFDTGLVFFSRIRKGKRFYQGDRTHTYHRLVKLGFSSHRAVLTMIIVSTVFSFLGFISLLLPPLWANLIFISSLVCAALAFFWLENMMDKQ